jgi:outer membrane protein assembly factor BamB
MNDQNESSDGDVADASSAEPKFKPLRVWPLLILGIVFAMMLLSRFVASPLGQMATVLGPALCGILMIGWWVTFSRARWQERLLGLIGVVGAFAVTFALLDESMKGGPTVIITIPMGAAAFAIGALLCRNSLSFRRTVVVVTLAALGFGASTLLRGQGMWGNAAIDLDWRFRQTAEERLVAAKAIRTVESGEEHGIAEFSPGVLDTWLAKPEWPAFRGPNRSGNVVGTKLDTDWTANPPQLLWKVPVGPGWSSFAVAGQLLFTQEQRGKMETVVCYDANSGRELWTCGIESRFEESLGGPGPRATPTVADGDLFVMGASGQLMRIDAKSGEVQWQADLREVAQRQPPTWGFSSSPLVIDSVVIVHAGGKEDMGTLAFDIASGSLVWSAAAGDHSYASPQICEVGGGRFVTMVTNAGVDFIDVASGEIKLTYDWKLSGRYRSLQPRVVGDDLVLIPSDEGSGTRLLRVTSVDDALTAEEVWTSRNLKPDFNDMVTFEGHAYGFDGTIFACVDLETGERNWKKGRYGKGQVVLIRDAGLLLIAAERGNVVLLKASPDAHEELGSIDAIDGKTWNHPVIVGDRLYIRNSAEAACYRLPAAAQSSEGSSEES